MRGIRTGAAGVLAAALGLGAMAIPAQAATKSHTKAGSATTVPKSVMLAPKDLPKGWKLVVTKDTSTTPTTGFAGLETCEGVTPAAGAKPPSRLRELQVAGTKGKTKALTVEESMTRLAAAELTGAWSVVSATAVVGCVEPKFAASITTTPTLKKAGYTATAPTATKVTRTPQGAKTASFTMDVQLKQSSGTTVIVTAYIFSAVRHGYLVGLTMLCTSTLPPAESARVDQAALKAVSAS